MKKTALITAVLLCATASAGAYQNSYAGYSVKDGQPFMKVETRNTYSYSASSSAVDLDKLDEKKQSLHVVQYFTAEEMAKVLEEPFSAAYFAKEYEKLALLERSELSLKTMPTPMLEDERYLKVLAGDDENTEAALLDNALVKQIKEKLKPTLSLSQINGQKVINVTYLYKQQDRYACLKTSLLTANDRLYKLSTISFAEDPAKKKEEVEAAEPDVDEEVLIFGDEDDAAEAKEKDEKAEQEETKVETPEEALNVALKKATEIENISASELPESLATDWEREHKRFLKGFKALTPSSEAAPLSYSDNISGKKVTLPQDWFYGQLEFTGTDITGNVTYAASLTNMLQLAKELRNDNYLLDLVAATSEAEAEAANEPKAETALTEEQAKEVMKTTLDSIDAILMSGSLKSKNNDLADMFIGGSTANKLQLEMMLGETLKRLQSFSSPYFKLDKYGYQVDLTKDKADIKVNTDFSLLQELPRQAKLLLSSQAQTKLATALLWYHKPDYEAEKSLQEAIDSWHF